MFEIRFDRRARTELRDAQVDAIGRGYEAAFRDEVLAAVDRMRELPQMFALVSPKIRRALLRRTGYAVFFMCDTGEQRVIVLAVLPQRANPTRWPK